MNLANKKYCHFSKLIISMILFSCGTATVNAQNINSDKDSGITILGKEKVPKILPKIDREIQTQSTFRTVCAASLKSDNIPLCILDGKIIDYDQMWKLDPDSIDKVEVLKSTFVTALYGAKGKNGVITITSKQNISNKKQKISE